MIYDLTYADRIVGSRERARLGAFSNGKGVQRWRKRSTDVPGQHVWRHEHLLFAQATRDGIWRKLPKERTAESHEVTLVSVQSDRCHLMEEQLTDVHPWAYRDG